MAKALQRRRGTTAEHANFTGLEGEFTYNTTEKRIVAHDGVTKGGIPMATKKEVEEVANSLDPRILDAASQADILEAVSQATVGNVDAPALEGLQAQIAANASNIASIPVPVRYVTETWSDGTNWYTKFSDGWIEQGGYFVGSTTDKTISFPVEFRDLSYTPKAIPITDSSNAASADWYLLVLSEATTSMVVRSYLLNIKWEAAGYCKE